MERLAEHGISAPDVGYWAAERDPDGTYHPLLYTRRVGDHWVNVTGLPLVYAAVPLWRVAGPTGILLLPLLGSVTAALAARRLARALGASHGWVAFWAVGLGSSTVFYAGDFWEHSLGLGVGLLGIALVLERIAQDDPVPFGRALVAGLVLGAAVVLRAEVAVYVVSLAVAVLLFPSLRRTWLRLSVVVTGTIGLAIPLVGNEIVERVVVGTGVRTSRATGNVADAGAGLGDRLSDGMLTTLAFLPERSAKSFVTGALLLGCLFVLGWRAVGGAVPERAVLVGAAGVAGLLLARLSAGRGFVPGVLPAVPLAMVGVAEVTARRSRAAAGARATALVAVVALPIVWTFQWRGDILPQWGGRYVLLSGALLAVVGAVALEREGRWHLATAVVTVAAVVLTLFGAAWHVERTRGVARAGEALESAPPDVVLVTDVAHLPRELGAFYGDHRWLMAQSEGQLDGALSVAAASGAPRLDVVRLDAGERARTVAGYEPTTRRTVSFLGVPLVVQRYERAPAARP